jgi:hypothetical protein
VVCTSAGVFLGAGARPRRGGLSSSRRAWYGRRMPFGGAPMPHACWRVFGLNSYIVTVCPEREPRSVVPKRNAQDRVADGGWYAWFWSRQAPSGSLTEAALGNPVQACDSQRTGLAPVPRQIWARQRVRATTGLRPGRTRTGPTGFSKS